MNVLCTIASHGEARTFEGTRGTGTAIDVVLKSGSNTILASAFDALAERIIKGEFNAQSLLSADIVFTVRQSREGDKMFQSCRIDNLAVIFDMSKAF